MPMSLSTIGFVRKAIMATAVAATLGTAAIASTQPAEAYWGGPGWHRWHHGFYHHGWGYRGWHRAALGYHGGWGHGYGWRHVYGVGPCGIRRVLGPYGWRHIRVC